MEKQTYRRTVLTIQKVIAELTKQRDRAGYSHLVPEKRTEKAIEIQNEIRKLQNKIQELYQKQKGEI